MDETRLQFGLLGPLLVTTPGRPVDLGGPKQRAVLAVLLINRNRAVSTESLIDEIWEQSPAPAARTSIHSYLSNLRRLLGDGEADPHAVLANARPGYRLRVPAADCDLDRFFTRKAEGLRAAAAGRFGQASSRYLAARNEWRGPALDDLRDFAFAREFATALTEDQMSVQVARAEAEIACGRAEAIIGDLEALTAKHPYHEPLWAQLMTAYYVAQRQAPALDAYRRLRAILGQDLGVDPGPAISALHTRMLRQERLDIKQASKTTAAGAVARTRPAPTDNATVARLRDATGQSYALQGAITRIGRLADNDIVLDDDDVSRHHAVIIDTGGSFMITDLRSANAVHVGDQRLDPSAPLVDGDRITICGHEFIFEVQQP
jgi:DNA-binding SARP family transcriptional activator